MNDFLIDRLDKSVSELLAGDSSPREANAQLRELTEVAEELRCVPNPAFRADLRAALLEESSTRRTSFARLVHGSEGHDNFSDAVVATERACGQDLRRPAGGPLRQVQGGQPALRVPAFRTGVGGMPLTPSHLAWSFGLHAVAIALIVGSGYLVVKKNPAVRAAIVQLIPANDDYPLPVAPGKIGGGGGGGDQDKLPASHGSPPRFAAEQLTPPAVVVRNENPILPAEPTVIGPPDLILPQSDKYGDPMANILNPPSNGPGSGGGIGSGRGGGVGSGEGPGVGEGSGGGIGGGIYRVGGGISAPRPIYDPEPEYSQEARKAKFQGIVTLAAIIGADGRPRDLRVVRSLGMGLDEKAMEAVRKWRFTPGMKDDHPVAVMINIEVAFRLY
jgi:TonB family protein